MNLDDWGTSGVVIPKNSHLQQAVDALRNSTRAADSCRGLTSWMSSPSLLG